MSRRTKRLFAKRTDRRGFTLTETTVAMVILAAAIVAVAQLMAAVATHRITADREALARQEAANLMERVFAMSRTESTEEDVASLQLSETCLQRLPDPKLNVSVESASGTPAGRQIQVEITWLDSSGHYRRNVSLTAWRYTTEEPGQ